MTLINYPFKNYFPVLVKYMGLLFLFTIILNPAQSKPVPNPRAAIVYAFFKKSVMNTRNSQRTGRVINIYRDSCRSLDEPTAMLVLDSVRLLARQLQNKPMECCVYQLRADYYATHRGYNTLSIAYHQQAVDFAINHRLAAETGIYLHKRGLFFFKFNHYTEACLSFLRAYDQFKQTGFAQIPHISRYLAEQARFYYLLKDYKKATLLIKTALSCPIKDQRVHTSLTTTIGLIYRGKNQFPEALHYFNQSLAIARANKDSSMIGISMGNIGSIYVMQGHIQKALPYLAVAYVTCQKFREYGSSVSALLRISSICLYNNQFKQAAIKLDSAGYLIPKSKNDALLLYIELYSQKITLYQKTGKLQEALAYAKKYATVNDSLSDRDSRVAVERANLEWETEKYYNQLKKLEANNETEAFKRNTLIVILFLLIVIFVLLFNRYRLKAKKDKEILLTKKRQVDEELRNAAASLQLYTENLKQSNSLIEKFKAEIDRFKTQSTDSTGAKHLERLMQAHIMTDETWNEFKKLFTKVHAGFFLKLRRNFPYLTDTDMRLLSLTKLGLNNKEMAAMLGITIEGIKKAKQRLRKKMQLPSDSSIEKVLDQL